MIREFSSSSTQRHLDAVTGLFRVHAQRRQHLAATIGCLLPYPGAVPDSSKHAANPVEFGVGSGGRRYLTPFEEVIASVTGCGGIAMDGPIVQPPSSRFMVRVANVEPPHRKTKRDYDYFQQLDDALAAQGEKLNQTEVMG